MFVPRSFHLASAPPPLPSPLDEKDIIKRRMPTTKNTKGRKSSDLKLASPPRATPTIPVSVRTSTPSTPVRIPERAAPTASIAMPATRHHTRESKKQDGSPHDPKALPPAVAALLAVTQIPRPKAGQFRRTSAKSPRRQMSIDELVNEWNNDDMSTFDLAPALGVLLENSDDLGEADLPAKESVPEERCTYTERSTSSDSVPSLDADERSLLSIDSPSTPESLRSKRSISNLRKQSPRSVPTTEDCDFDHPLLPKFPENDAPEDTLLFSPSTTIKTRPPKPKATFTSNLTTSLQALKTAALNSISSFNRSGTTTGPALVPSRPAPHRMAVTPFSDDVLWSHPFLFPHFSPEIRPAIGSPSSLPAPLTFEEQERPYQQALHGPYLAERIEGAPTIQMQTYGAGGRAARRRGGASNRRGGGGASSPDPSSEAGRALLGAAGLRPRELRENSDFLRVVVLEMNMKRSGKLETGRARLWLPPRQASVLPVQAAPKTVPARWVGVSAY